MERRASRRWIVGFALIAVAIAVAAWAYLRQADERPAYRTARIERGSLQAAVAATGTVTPVTQVQVGTQVSGQISALHVDFNSEVKAGQLLARIDPQSFEYRLRQLEADLDAARAGVLNARAAAAAALAAVERSRVDHAEARRVVARSEELVAQNFFSPAQLETQRAVAASAAQSVKAAEAQATVAAAQVTSAEAVVKQRAAAVAQARIDIERTQIRSPVDGVVIKRSIELGQTVAASLQAPELFVIARNLDDMQVQAGIDEADISRVRIGQKAGFTVDAYPGRALEGTVTQVRQAATNTQNVITYTVIVGFANTAPRLLPGMTANVRLVTDARDAVLKVSNAALRVRVPGVEPPGREASSAAGATSAIAAGDGVPAVRADGASQGAGEPGGAAGGRGGALAAWRQRVLGDLQLSAAQQSQVDAIFAELRPRFAELRSLPEEERPKARERAMGEVRARGAAVLTPGQKKRYDALVAEQAQRQPTRGRLYLVAADGSPRAVNVRLGITDGTMTELVAPPAESGVVEGAEVIVGVPAAAGAAAARSRGPRLSL